MLLKNIPILILSMGEYWEVKAYWNINFISCSWLVIVYTEAMTLGYWEEEMQIHV